MTDLSWLNAVTEDLLARYDRPGPRYTSYPTAVAFHDGVDAAAYKDQLHRADAVDQAPWALYVHIPFCRTRCTFCGCTTQVCADTDRAGDYLRRVFAEMDAVRGALHHRTAVAQIHLGGGTPTFLRTEQLAALCDHIADRFDPTPDCERSIEVNPATCGEDTVTALADMGFNRISFGVQDFDPAVLQAIGRGGSLERTARMIAAARRAGFGSVNLDLVYGLPHQTPDSFARTLDQLRTLRPDRIALYSFAYIPWVRENQQGIDPDALPDRATKFALFAQAVRTLVPDGYVQIGMDHFALATDAMAQAMATGRLHRNFMGYTVLDNPEMLGFGASAIGFVGRAYVQNHKDTDGYESLVDGGRLPVVKGIVLSDDDIMRRYVIEELMCNFAVRSDAFLGRFGRDFAQLFAPELERLEAQRHTDHPFTEWDGHTLRVTPVGRLFVRNVCMEFDVYLDSQQAQRPVFSRTV